MVGVGPSIGHSLRCNNMRARKADTTNFRIVPRSLSMSRAYLRTIEVPASISLISLAIGKADCR
jgi:hypothetical protein